MELFFPDQINLSLHSIESIKDARDVAVRVSQHRPLSDAIVRRVTERILGEQVYSSNALEGSTLDYRETVLVLKGGAIGGRKKREAGEARNLGAAARELTKWLDEDRSCQNVDDFLYIHGLVLKDMSETAGRFRAQRVMIAGAKHQPPDDAEVPGLFDKVFAVLNDESSEIDPVVIAVWAHWAITRIHPFQDGNGRMARLWQDLLLTKAELVNAIIRPQDRRKYLDSLQEADDGNFDALSQIISNGISRTYDIYLEEIRRDEKGIDFIRELTGEVDAPVKESQSLAYSRWSRMMEKLRFEFELAAARVSENTTNLQIQVHPYPIIDQSNWENIRAGIGTQKTWYLVIEFDVAHAHKRYYLFFGRHIWRQGLDTSVDRAEQRVCLLVSEDDGSGRPPRLDDIDNCLIRLREVFVVEDQFVCRIRPPAAEDDVYDREWSAQQIAQEFIKDVVLRRLA